MPPVCWLSLLIIHEISTEDSAHRIDSHLQNPRGTINPLQGDAHGTHLFSEIQSAGLATKQGKQFQVPQAGWMVKIYHETHGG